MSSLTPPLRPAALAAARLKRVLAVVAAVCVGGLGRCVVSALMLSLALAGSAQATFPGHNGRIAFMRPLDADPSVSIFTLRPDGFGLERVTAFGSETFAGFPDWSPDGRKLAVERGTFETPPEIWITEPDGSGMHQLTTGSLHGTYDPAWAPDARALAVEGTFEEQSGIYLIPARTRHGELVTGAQARRITRVTDGGFDSEPQFSPDGRWVVFTRYSVECQEDETFDRCTTRIFRVRSSGQKLQQLVDARFNASAPDFHPSGRWIAFDTHDNFVAPNAGNIDVMRPDGSGKRVIIRGDGDDFFNNPAFSPDGRGLAFARWPADVPDAGSRIWVARADGAGPHALANSLEGDNKPDWGSADRHHHHGGDQ